MPNWKPTVKVNGKWEVNSLVFATKEEAEENAKDLMSRWMLVTDSMAVPTELPVNYRMVDGQLTNVEEDDA
jgi:hypothetical protein